MARQPVQLPSRGGANAAGVGNRAQYLRPAKDTQNSRALSSAFSQMNRAFSRIAANEDRLENQRLADEFREAEEEQKLLEQRAAVAGQIDVLTGQDQSSAYASNAMALKSYSEGHMQATMSEGLVGIGTEFKEQPFYGDPLRQAEAEQWIQDNIQTAIGQAPLDVVGSMLPQIQKLGFNLLQENDAAVFETAKAQTVTDMQSNLYLSLINGDSEAFIGLAYLERENASLDIGKVAANDGIVQAFGFALDRAAGGSEGEWRRASDAATDLLRSDFMKGLSAEQQAKMRDLEVAARQHFNSNQNERSRRAQEEVNRQIGVLQTDLQDALEGGLGYTAYKAEFMRLDPEGGEALYQKQVDAFYQRNDHYLPTSDANDMASRTNLARHTHYLDANNIQPGTKAFNDYVLDAIAEGQMTEDDAKKLKAHDTNMGLEVKSNPEYDFTRQAFRSFSDAVLATVPGIEKSNRAASEMRGFEGDGSDFRKLDLLFEQELYATQKSYPQDAAGQKAHIDDAAYRAIRRYLSGTEYKANGETVNLLDKMGDMEGGLDKLLKSHPAFRQLFDELGYFERGEKRNAEIEAAKAQAAEVRRQNDAAMDEALLPPLPVGEQTSDAPAPTAREKSLADIDRLLEVTQSLNDEVNRLTEPERAAQREAATAAGDRELEDIDLSVQQTRMLEKEAAQLQAVIQEDIKAMDAEIARQQTVIEQAKAAASVADARLRVLNGSATEPDNPATNMARFTERMESPSTVEEIELPQELRSSGRGEPATAPPISMPSQMSTLDTPQQASPTPVETATRQRASAPTSEDASAIPSMEGATGSPSIQMPSQMSTLDVPETSEATAIPTSSYEGSGQAVSSPDAAPIPDLTQRDSTASIVLDYLKKTGAKEPEEAAKAKTAFDFAKGYLGNTEKENHKVLSAFIKKVFPNDFNDVRQTAWCAGFVNAVLNAEGTKGTGKLNARSFMKWGVEVTDPSEGDVVVFWRESKSSWKGHVGFFAGYDDEGDILVLGGNQNDSVSIKSYPKERLLGFRRAE